MTPEDTDAPRCPHPSVALGDAPWTGPLARFYAAYPGLTPPHRGDRTVMGSARVRANQFCEPFSAAAEWGWYIYPPIDFALYYDGMAVLWRPLDEPDWELVDRYVTLPDMDEHWQNFPLAERFSAPISFVDVGPDVGEVQLWSGLFATTAPGWSLLVKPVANLPRQVGVEFYEGMVEFDHWAGALSCNIRISKTDIPLVFSKDRPLFMVAPVPQLAYHDQVLASMEMLEADQVLAPAVAAMEEALAPRNERGELPQYRRQVRRRRRKNPGLPDLWLPGQDQ